jgi:hypothetical protein
METVERECFLLSPHFGEIDQMISAITLGRLSCFIQVWFLLSAAMALAEVVQVGNIMTRPEAYHLKDVQLQGVATHVQALPPAFMSKFGTMCYGAYTFTLDDETGSIVVEVPSMCGRSQEAVTIIAENQKVSVAVRIEAPGYYTGSGIVPPGEVKSTTRAIALREPSVQDR